MAHDDGLGLSRVVLRRKPVAEPLHEGRSGAVRVGNDKRLRRLAALHAGREHAQGEETARGQGNGLPGCADDIGGIGRAESEQSVVPGLRAAEQRAGVSRPAAVETAGRRIGERGAVGVNPWPVKIASQRHALNAGGQRRGDQHKIRIAGERQALDGLGRIQRQAIAVHRNVERLRSTAAQVTVRHPEHGEFARVTLRVGPIAKALGEGGGRVVRIGDRQRSRDLVAVNSQAEELQRVKGSRRQGDSLPGADDHVGGIGGAEVENKTIPGKRRAQQVGG